MLHRRTLVGLLVLAATALAAAAPPKGTQYLVVWLKTEEGREYRPAARELVQLRDAEEFGWSGVWEDLERELFERKPAHLAMVLPPEAIDGNLPRQLALVLTRFDDDPFLDCRLGIITGSDGRSALTFVRNIAKATGNDVPNRRVSARIEAADTSNRVGPNALESTIDRAMRSTQLLIGSRDPQWRTFVDGHRQELMDAGIIEIVHGGTARLEGMSAEVLFGGSSIFPAIVINGASHAIEEDRAAKDRIDDTQAHIESHGLLSENMFLLEAIEEGAVAYIARLGAGSPNRAPLEEWLLLEGDRSLGEAMRVAHDDLVIGALADDVMREQLVIGARDGIIPEDAVGHYDDVPLRVLFGDPAFIPFRKRLPSNHRIDLAVTKDEIELDLSWTDVDRDPWVWDGARADSSSGVRGRMYERIVLPFGMSLDNDHLVVATDLSVKATTGRDQVEVPSTGLTLRERDPDGRSVLHVLVREPELDQLKNEPRRRWPRGTDRLEASLEVVFVPTTLR